VSRYGDQLKATAVKLSSLSGVLIQDVAAALDIHPFMLSLWRKEVRDGVIMAKSARLDVQTTAELKRLRDLERRYKILKEEHTLLKKPSGLLPIKNGSLRVHRSKPGRAQSCADVQGVWRDARRLLWLAASPAGQTGTGQCDSTKEDREDSP
jgi:transposase